MAHPWLAGAYIGFFGSVVLTVLYAPIMIQRELWPAFVLGAAMWLFSGFFIGIGLKRYWKEQLVRPDAERHRAATAQRIWSGASDRFLLACILLGPVAVAAWTIELLLGGPITGNRRWVAAVGLAASIWLVATTWAERRRRRTSD